MLFLFKIGFLPVGIFDLLDILIFGYLIFLLYKLLRGSIGFNILIGVIIFFVLWWVVKVLKMDLLSLLLNQVVNLGVIILIIIFQPEVRRFLLMLGNTTLRRRSRLWQRFLDKNQSASTPKLASVVAIKKALLQMSKEKTGVLIILSNDINLEGITNSGTVLNAKISEQLLESIFNKNSPLHDGAVIIENDRIKMASVVLPVSDSKNLPRSVGLRHRAAVGLAEKADITALIVSEETGGISIAQNGKLYRNITEKRLEEILNEKL